MSAPRTGAELVRATRVFSEENPRETWRLFLTTVAVGLVLAVLAAQEVSLPLAWTASVILGAVNVRFFIFFHDCMHGAIFRKSRLGRELMKLYGLLILTPERVWKDSHNYHHAHTSKIVGSSVGSFPILTVRMYRCASRWNRFRYRAARHWLTMLFGYFTVFTLGMCVRPFLQAPRRNVGGLAALVLHYGLVAALAATVGPMVAFRIYLFPLMVSCALGSYLFYAQHTFPGMVIHDRRDWEYTAAALHSSSMMEMGPLMQWLTGNIGFHHVHHLSSLIPFYRLPEAAAGLPELGHPIVTSLSPRDILRCLRIHLWDPERRAMLSYREALEPRCANPPQPQASAPAA